MAKIKIFLVTEPNGNERLVRAVSKSEARDHVMQPGYTVVVATADDIAGRRELTIEEAGE